MTGDGGFALASLGEIVQFRNGKSMKPGGDGAHAVYGSNGIIGASDEHLYEDAIILGRVGAYCGSVAYCPSEFWASDNTIVVEPRQDRVDTLFTYFLLKNANLNRHAGGAAQPLLTQSRLKTLEFSIPTLPTQRRIASILSAYDDLIGNNTRRIAILEEMARRLYEEWFVHFRFPGHERVKMVESEFGEVPEGWAIRALVEVATVNAHSIRKGEAPHEIQYIDIKSVSTGRVDRTQEMLFADAPSRARRVVRSGDIMWSAVRPNLRAYALILDPTPNTIASTGFATISPREVPFSVLYPALTRDEFVEYLVNHATGAAYPAVNQKDFEAARLVVPPGNLLEEYNQLVEPMLLLAHRLALKNTNLRTQRDLLLPKLISGEIDVSQLADPSLESAA